MRATESKDGILRITKRVEYRISLENLVWVGLDFFNANQDRIPTRKEFDDHLVHILKWSEINLLYEDPWLNERFFDKANYDDIIVKNKITEKIKIWFKFK